MAVYVDGFNLYYGLKSRKWQRYYWLDIRRLAQKLLRGQQTLAVIRYFTARISAPPDDPAKSKRQSIFLEALQTLPDFHIQYGRYMTRTRQCSHCRRRWEIYEEKMTDVNIAVALLNDAQDDRFDTAIVISADSDLTTPVGSTIRRYPDKRVVVAFPPGRHSDALRKTATACFTVGRRHLGDSQFPDEVTKADGYVLRRPREWR